MNDWRLWQLVDSAFPTGGFTHSGGLESAWQLGFVPDGASLAEFLNSAGVQIERGVARFVRRGWEHPQELGEIDRDCDLFLNNAVANRASRSQGSAMLASTAKIFLLSPLTSLAADARQRKLACHLAPVYGAVCKCLDVELKTAIDLFIFTSLRSALSAAVRLGIVGPIEAQRIQTNLSARPLADGDEPVQTSPLLDLVHGMHDRLDSRLFQS